MSSSHGDVEKGLKSFFLKGFIYIYIYLDPQDPAKKQVLLNKLVFDGKTRFLQIRVCCLNKHESSYRIHILSFHLFSLKHLQ